MPVATVLRFVGGKQRLRKGRGFSLGELQQAGLKRPQARSFKIRTDQRRSTVHAQNVAVLKAFLASLTPKTSEPEPSVEAPAEEAKPKKGPPSRKEKAKPRRVRRGEKPKS